MIDFAADMTDIFFPNESMAKKIGIAIALIASVFGTVALSSITIDKFTEYYKNKSLNDISEDGELI